MELVKDRFPEGREKIPFQYFREFRLTCKVGQLVGEQHTFLHQPVSDLVDDQLQFISVRNLQNRPG
jgi:hypothetical protein